MLSRDPLTEAEFEELDQFLLNVEGLDASMDIAMLDGFFAAILSGPKTILPSEWMRWVWDTEKGEQTPVYESLDQAQRIMGLMMRHMNAVATTLLEAPEDYEPVLMENTLGGDPVPVIDEWCTGYMLGVGLDSAGWLPITVGHPAWLSTIILYGTEDGWEQLKKKDLPIEEHRRLAGGLGDSVRKLPGAAPSRRVAGGPSRGAPGAPAQCGQGRSQRSLPLRVRQEVQALSRRDASTALRRLPLQTRLLVVFVWLMQRSVRGRIAGSFSLQRVPDLRRGFPCSFGRRMPHNL